MPLFGFSKSSKGLKRYEELANLFYTTRDIKKYSANDVDEDTVRKLIEAAVLAHSMGDAQPWEFVIVRDETTKRHIVEACYSQTWMLRAPVLIIACVNNRIEKGMYAERGERLYGIQDVACAIQNLRLAARAFGLGTAWIGEFAEARVSAAVHCDQHHRPCAIITVGWPVEKPKAPFRHSVDEVMNYEEIGQSEFHKTVMKAKTKRV